MVYESPAAGRPMACRKHSPWTMERDRKKSKAHLGSPEPLSEEVEEDEEEEPDDHEMTEQMLACFDKLTFGGFLARTEELDGAALSRAGSAPDGQRRKLRGSRALSASYHSRLRSCVLNEKGGPLPHSSRSYTTGAGGDQENAAPILFGPVMFADHSKCWIGRRHSPTAKDTSSDPTPHQGSTGVIPPPSFPMHGLALNSVSDRCLLATAALASSSRSEKHIYTARESPAPKGRSHRRSHSGASVGNVGGLNDSAEALHGPSDACAAGQGQPPQPADWPHLRSTSEGSAAQRHGPVLRQGVAAGGNQAFDRTWQAAAPAGPFDAAQGSSDATDVLPTQARFPLSSSASALNSAPATSAASMAKYGIAAFGVAASVQSCFADTIAPSAQRPSGVTASTTAAAAPMMGPQHELARCAMSCPEDIRNAATAAGAKGRLITHPAGLGSFAGSSGAVAVSGGSLASGSLLGFAIEALADTSEPVIVDGSYMRHGVQSLGSGAGKALADSAEELELRRLANQQPPHTAAAAGQQLSRQSSLGDQQPARLPPPPSLMDQLQQQQSCAARSRPASLGSAAAAAAAAGTFGAAVSEPLPDPVAKPAFAPFDLLSLARSAGSVLGTVNPATNLSTSGHFTIEAVQGAVGGPTPPLQPFGLWSAAHSSDGRHGSINSSFEKNDDGSSKPGGNEGIGGSIAWPATGFAAFSAVPANALARAGAPGGADAGAPVLELTCSVGVSAGVDVRADQDNGEEDGGEPWLRTSQQAPDPDDPSSAGKYSAVLLRRLQAAAEHEELYGVPASGGHSGAYNFFHLQGSCGSDYGLRSSSGRLHLGSHGSSSMEPSPMPRLSSRLRRLRASPCPGSGGSGGPLTSPAPSLLLGTRSRSAGVTPGGATCRRLRRRSDLLVPDQLGGQGSVSVSARGYADIDELDDSDAVAGADEDMHDAGGHQLRSAGGGSEDRLRLLAARMGDQAAAHRRRGAAALPLHPDRRGSAGGSGAQHLSATPGRRSEPMQRLPNHQLQQAGTSADLAVRAHSAAGQLLQQHRAHTGNDFLSGLMDYEDDGVEYMTPPHTPLRGISGAHDHDAVTAPRAALGSFTLCGGGRNPAATAAEDGLFAIAPGRGRPGPAKGVLPQRVTFAAHRQGYSDTLPASPVTAAGGSSCEDGSAACAQMLMSQSLSSTQEFNRCLASAANHNNRGAAERLWQEMCSRGVMPDVNTLNSLLRCLSRSAADPEEAHLLVRDVCNRGGFDANGTSQRLLEEICFRFEQLNGSALG